MKIPGLTSKPTAVAEYEAEGTIEQVYHEIRQSLRVSGVRSSFTQATQVVLR